METFFIVRATIKQLPARGIAFFIDILSISFERYSMVGWLYFPENETFNYALLSTYED